MASKYAHINFIPPESVQSAAKRGLEMRRKYGRGGLDTKEASKQGIGSGVQRATNLANGNAVSPETIGRMVSFFARHEKNKDSKTDSGEPGAGQIAWLLWGGNPGKQWAEKVKRQMEAADMKNKSLVTLANQILTVRGRVENNPQNGGFLPSGGPIVGGTNGEYHDIPRPLPLTYKAGVHTGAMIALFLPTSYGTKFYLANRSNATPPNEMHVTLAYLGEAGDLSYQDEKNAHYLTRLLAGIYPSLSGNINGCGRFCNGGDDGDPFFIIPDLPDLPDLRQDIIHGLKDYDISPENKHGYTPHITLTYIPHSNPNPFDQVELTPVTFPAISLVLGDTRYDYPFSENSPLTKAALIEKIGARHTGAENALIQQMHDLALELGADCHPMTRRAGARHSLSDQTMVQRIHDDCRELGAACKAMAPRDHLYYSQVMKESEVERGSAGSGNFGHDGRPGKLGGSSKGGGLKRIGAKKDTPPGKRKEAAKRYREKQKKGGGSNLSKIVNNPKSFLSGGAQVALVEAGKEGAKQHGIIARVGDREALRELADSGLGTFSKSGIGNSDIFKINKDGLTARDNLTKSGKKKATKKSINSMSTAELNMGFATAKNHKERVKYAEALIKDFSDNTIAASAKEIPKSKDALLTVGQIATGGKNAIYRGSKGITEFGKVLQNSDGDYYNANFGKKQKVTPIFRSDFIAKGQLDAPNYKPASTPRRCENCAFIQGNPGEDYCTKFDFAADQDYVCDAWETLMPDEIPGYVAGKASLAELTETVLKLRGFTS